MGLDTKNPILELFYFHRVVIDEAHELHDEFLSKGRAAPPVPLFSTCSCLSSTNNSLAISLFNASNWWFVSGAPITRRYSSLSSSLFPEFTLVISTRLKLAYLMGLGDMDRRFCDSMIYDYFMWRNTKCTLDIKYLRSFSIL